MTGRRVYSRPPIDGTEEEKRAWAKEMTRRVIEAHRAQKQAASDEESSTD